MHLIEIFLPLHDNQGSPFGPELLDRVRDDLTERFGGVTAFTRSPAQGTYDSGDDIQNDDIVVVEVMTEQLDRKWWASYREKLEQDLSQKEIFIREMAISRL